MGYNDCVEENQRWGCDSGCKEMTWTSGTTYDMYRHDISRTTTSKPSGATSLYNANYYVVNEDYKVYICLQNGTNPENPSGRPSLDQPTFTDLEPRARW